MRVGFPLSMLGEKKLADDFHGSHWIGSYDVKTKEFTEVATTDLAGENLIATLKDLGIRLVVCNKMKPMALKFFKDQNITVYKAQSNLVDLNLELLLDGQLDRFDAQMAEAVSCGSSCSSCGSSCK